MKFKDGLNNIVGSQAKVDLLRYMVNNPGEYTGRDLAFKSAMSHTQANRILDEFTNSGLVEQKRAGRSFLYSLNDSHYFVNDIKNLFNSEDKALDRVADIVRSKVGDSLRYLIIFGSVARGEEGPSSDIDMVVSVKDHSIKRDLDELALEISNESIALTGSPAHPLFVEESVLKNEKSRERRAAWSEIFGSKPVIAWDYTGEQIKRIDLPKGEFLINSLGFDKERPHR
jgi:predicted nucleotidyltransferase